MGKAMKERIQVKQRVNFGRPESLNLDFAVNRWWEFNVPRNWETEAEPGRVERSRPTC